MDEKDQSLFEKISEQILQNIRITVENFHFSYQTESTSKLGHRFSFGLTFQLIQIIVIPFHSLSSLLSLKIQWKILGFNRREIQVKIEISRESNHLFRRIFFSSLIDRSLFDQRIF